MKLYHGTHIMPARNSLIRGIRSRGNSQNKWKNAPSHPRCVYLSNAYAPYFAMCNEKALAAIIEIETDHLDVMNLLPDEDALEQVGRGIDHKEFPECPKFGMVERTAWYRDHLEDWANGESWKVSLKAMGNCSHLGPIPKEAIERIVVIDKKKAPITCAFAMDPVICTLNYRYCGHKYRALTHWIFGDEHEEPDDIWSLPPESERQTFKLIYDRGKGIDQSRYPRRNEMGEPYDRSRRETLVRSET